MSIWTEDDFLRVAAETQLSKRTLAACADVLVNGMAGVDVASFHVMKTSQISRGLSALRERREELKVEAELLMGEGELLKSKNRNYVAQLAKNVVGDGLEIVDAVPGKVYEGRAIVDELGLVVQQVGRKGVVHDHGNLERIPVFGSLVTISCRKDGGRAVVVDGVISDVRDVGKGWER